MNAPIPGVPRAYRGELDLQPIYDLMHDCEVVDQQEDWPDLDNLRDWFTSPGVESERDLQLWEDASGQLVGFAFAWSAKEDDSLTLDSYLQWRVHPLARGGGLEAAIVAWAEERVQREAAQDGRTAAVYSRIRESYTYGRNALEAQGFAPVRYYFNMTRDLTTPIPPLEMPPGYTLRHVTTDEEIAAWVDCFNQSFIDHWNHHPITFDNRKHWIADTDHRPTQDLILVAPDGTVAAFSYCTIQAKDNAHSGRNEGWIHVLGTRRGYRQQGLGRAALVAGLQRLHADGATTAVLNVDSENPTGALGMYEGVGFTKRFQLINYCKAVG